MFQMFVSLTNKTTNEKLHFVIKQALKASSSSDIEVMANTYFNEIHFYQNIWRAFDGFQRKFPRMEPFNKIPIFYGSCGEFANQKLVLENLKYSGHRMFPRNETFADTQVEFLMISYGQFHGISAAFREHNPEEYKKLMDPLKNSTENVINMQAMKGFVLFCMSQVIPMVKDEKIKRELEKYRTQAIKLALDATKYKGKNPVFNHGDCWSNNLMVEYEVSMFIYICCW